MSIQPLTFTGVSSLSDSLQQVLTRAVTIAKIPLQQLQTQDADLLQKKTLLSGLGDAAKKLGDAVRELGTIAAGGALSAMSSNKDKVAVQNTGSTKPAAYTLSDIASLATAASASSGALPDSDTTRVSLTGKMRLTVDDKPYTFDLDKNNLTGLRDAINKIGAGVTASILTAGPNENYLSLSAGGLGKLRSLSLTDEPATDPVAMFASASLGGDGKAASATTAKVADPNAPISATGKLRFKIGTQSTTLNLSATDSLNSLKDAVDALDGVRASVETDGTRHWLSVVSDSAGEVSAIELKDEAGRDLFVEKDFGADSASATGTTPEFASSTTARVSMTGGMKLTVGGNTYDLNLTENSLTGLKAAIDAAGAGVTATIAGDAKGHHLTVTRNSTGETPAFALTDNPGGQSRELLAKSDLGSNATFKLNGIAMEHKTNTVNDVVPGMIFTILGTTSGAEKVTLNLTSDRNRVATAIDSFVSAYNAMQDLVGQQVGEHAGLLTGHGVVRDLQTALREIGGYRGEGLIRSLAEVGVTFDQAGTMSFDSAVFNGLSDSQFQAALSFFGSPDEGFGAVAKKFGALTDPVTGVFKIESDGFDRTDKSLQAQIATIEDRINELQASTARRLQYADALLAQLESQQTILDASVKSANMVLYGRNDK